MIDKMIPVEDHRGLSRDRHSNAIINTDRDAYLKAKMKKNALVEQRHMKMQIEELQKRCDNLEFQILQLKGINN
jgi:hypothetical protein